MSAHIIDDRDPSVQYYGPWLADANLPSSDTGNAFDNTLSVSEGVDQNSGFVFTFNGTSAQLRRCPLPQLTGIMTPFHDTGTSVAVTGGVIVFPGGSFPAANFTLDGGTPDNIVFTKSYNNTIANNLYSSGTLSNGQHMLNMTVVKSDDDSTIAIDNIIYTPSLTSESSAAPSGQAPTSVQSSPASATAATGKSSAPVGPIVGGVVGGVALFVLAGLAFYFLYWTRGRRARPFFYADRAGNDFIDSGQSILTTLPYGSYSYICNGR